jgi:hypothetical protein
MRYLASSVYSRPRIVAWPGSGFAQSQPELSSEFIDVPGAKIFYRDSGGRGLPVVRRGFGRTAADAARPRFHWRGRSARPDRLFENREIPPGCHRRWWVRRGRFRAQDNAVHSDTSSIALCLRSSPGIKNRSRLLVSSLPSTTNHLHRPVQTAPQSRRYSESDASQTLAIPHFGFVSQNFRKDAHPRTKIPAMRRQLPNQQLPAMSHCLMR